METLPQDIAAALKTAEPRRRRGPRFFVRAEGETYPVLDLNETGFTIAGEAASLLRGYVDLLHGDERLARCLIVLAGVDGGVARYEFKRRTEDAPQAPADYARDPDAPVAYIADLSRGA